LFFGEAAGEAGHFAFAVDDLAADQGVGCGQATGELGALENPVNLRRRGLEGEIVFLVAVSAADGVKVLALGLLRG